MLFIPKDRPTALLVACHERMRTFGRLASAIARDGFPGPAEIAEASKRLVRFFDLALPLHEADEEDTVGRLLPQRLPHLADAIHLMKEQHAHLHELLEELRPLWVVLRDEPDAATSQTWDLRSVARRFDAVLNVHLALEENVVFPAIDSLGEDFQDELRRELWDRRQHATRRQPDSSNGF